MYIKPNLVQDEATPILVPVSVVLIVAGLCIVAALFLIPWEFIPTPEVCNQVAVTSWTGKIKSYETVCSLDTSDRVLAGWAAGFVSLGVISLSLVATFAALRSRGNVR